MFGWGPPNIAIKTTGLVPQMAIPTPCPPYPHKLPFETWFLNLVLNLIFEVFSALDLLRKDESAHAPLPPYPHKLPFKTWFLNQALNLIFKVFWALDSLRKDESSPPPMFFEVFIEVCMLVLNPHAPPMAPCPPSASTFLLPRPPGFKPGSQPGSRPGFYPHTPWSVTRPGRDHTGTKPGPNQDQTGIKPRPNRDQTRTKPGPNQDQTSTKTGTETKPGPNPGP